VSGAMFEVPVALVAHFILQAVSSGQEYFFTTLPDDLGFHGAPSWWPLPLLALCGLVVGLSLPAARQSMACSMPMVSSSSLRRRSVPACEVASARPARRSSQPSGAAWALPGGSTERRRARWQLRRHAAASASRPTSGLTKPGVPTSVASVSAPRSFIVFAETLDRARQEPRDQRRSQILARARQMPLEVQSATRRAATGIAPDDPGLRQWAEQNRPVLARGREAGQ
jgi:hypothetical protein